MNEELKLNCSCNRFRLDTNNVAHSTAKWFNPIDRPTDLNCIEPRSPQKQQHHCNTQRIHRRFSSVLQRRGRFRCQVGRSVGWSVRLFASLFPCFTSVVHCKKTVNFFGSSSRMKGDEMSATTPSLQVQFSISPTIASIDRPAPEEVEEEKKRCCTGWRQLNNLAQSNAIHHPSRTVS